MNFVLCFVNVFSLQTEQDLQSYIPFLHYMLFPGRSHSSRLSHRYSTLLREVHVLLIFPTLDHHNTWGSTYLARPRNAGLQYRPNPGRSIAQPKVKLQADKLSPFGRSRKWFLLLDISALVGVLFRVLTNAAERRRFARLST